MKIEEFYQFDLNQVLSVDIDKVAPLSSVSSASAAKINECLERAIKEVGAIKVDFKSGKGAASERLDVVGSYLQELVDFAMGASWAHLPQNPLYQVLSNVLLLIQFEDEWGRLHASDVEKMSLLAWKVPTGEAANDIRYTPLINLRRLLDVAIQPARSN